MENVTPTESVTAPLEQAAGGSRTTPFERRRVLAAAVDLASPDEVAAFLTQRAQERVGCFVAGISAPYATAMQDDPALRDAFLAADLLVPDGKGFVWGARLLNVPCGNRVAVPDLCERLLAAGDARGWKVFVYGGTDAINAAACENLKTRFPGLTQIAGQHGYQQSTADEDAIIKRLEAEQFHLLLVARPSPDKEKFLARCCKRAGVVGLAVGGYADILAGKTVRAPRWVQAIGMEWLYRVLQEPRRLWKRVGWANARFAASVLWAHLRLPARRPPWACPALHALVIVLAVAAAYLPALNAPYHFDDPEYITENPAIRTFKGVSEIKVLAFRNVWWLSNAACYKLSELFGNHQVNKPDVRIFRAWNIACHLIAALALYGLLRRALRASGRIAPDDSMSGEPSDLLPAIAATIFAAHPLCTEAVTYISGRDNGQGGMFYLLGLYAAAIAFSRMGLSHSAPTAPALNASAQGVRWPEWFWPLVAMLIFGACAILTKESHLTYPAAVALLYVTFYRSRLRQTISIGVLLGLLGAVGALCVGAAGRRDGWLGVAAEAAVVLLIAGVAAGRADASVTGWRRQLQQQVNLTWAFLLAIAGLGAATIIAFPYAYQRTIGALTGYLESNYVRSLCTQAYAVPWMLLRAVLPYGLNIDHDFPTIATTGDPRVLRGALVLGALLLFGLFGAARRWVSGFGVLLALLVIAPTNSIIERGDIVSERNFYLVAVGGACVLAGFIASLTQFFGARLPDESDEKNALRTATAEARVHARLCEAGLWATVLGCCIGGPFVSLTVLRNGDWCDGYRLWDAARRRSPDKLRVLYNFGVCAFQRKRYDEAEMAFSNLIKIGEWMVVRKSLRPDESVQLKCFHLAYANYAAVQLRRYMAAGKPNNFKALQEVDQIFRNGIDRTGYDPDLCGSYSQYLMQLGRTNDAVPVLQQSFNLHPWSDQLYFPLGLAYAETGDFDNAVKYLSDAANYRERNTLGGSWEMPVKRQAEVRAFLGMAQLFKKNRQSARENFRMAIELDAAAIVTLLAGSTRIQNPKLKPVETNPPDLLLIQLSVTRRDVLETLLGAVEDVIKKQGDAVQTRIRMLRDNIDNELKRRATLQQKRRAFGFFDDPDAE